MRLPLSVWGLSLGQALLVTGNILLVSVSALVGQQIAPYSVLITLPVALQFIGLMSATIPAAHYMQIYGRKKGFLIGNVIGIAGGVLAFFALLQDFFLGFCVATFLLGIAIGVGQQYRFAAIEGCEKQLHSQAISLVMAGGVLAAVLGPNLAVWGEGLFSSRQYLGAFALLILLYILTAFIIFVIPLQKPTSLDLQQEGRSYRELFKQRRLLAAMLAGSIGYGVMVLIMTATPLAMQSCGFGFKSAASVIQWHVLGMFAPSFFTGKLIMRYSEVRIILVGCILLLVSMLGNQLGVTYWHFLGSLIALGVGWNFTFIGATSLLTQTYRPAEKARVQGVNDFVVFASAALASLLAGYWHALFGWEVLNRILLPLVVLVMLAVWLAGTTAKKIPSIDHPG